jgi:hypothetical protein
VEVFGQPRTPFTPAPVDNRRREFTPPGPVDRVSPVEPPPAQDGYDQLFEDVNRATDVEPPPAPKPDGYDQIFENINQATNVVDPPNPRYSYRYIGNQRVAIPK